MVVTNWYGAWDWDRTRNNWSIVRREMKLKDIYVGRDQLDI